MENRAAATRPADEGAIATCGMLVALYCRLKVTKRQRRFAPLIETERGNPRISGRFEQELVDGHIPRAVRGDVVEDADFFHGISRDQIWSRSAAGGASTFAHREQVCSR